MPVVSFVGERRSGCAANLEHLCNSPVLFPRLMLSGLKIGPAVASFLRGKYIALRFERV